MEIPIVNLGDYTTEYGKYTKEAAMAKFGLLVLLQNKPD